MGAFRIFRRLQDLLDVNPAGLADNDIPTWDAATSKFTMEAGGGGGGGGAPTTADYLVGTADATLSNEIVVGVTPGGELGNTWASPTVDTIHSGSSHAATQAAAEAASVILAPASSARNVIQPTAGTVIAAIVRAHAAQSVDLTQWQLSDGTVLGRIGPTGAVTISPSDLAAVPLTLSAPAGAEANFTSLIEFRTAEGGLIGDIDAAGYMFLTSQQAGAGFDFSTNQVLFPNNAFRIHGPLVIICTEPADGALNPGNFASYFDPTNGAAKVRFKGKTLDGTVVTWEIPNGVVYVAGGTDVAVADGGTGASTAAGARTNLGVIAANVPFTPAGTIAATDVQAAIEEVATEAGGGGGYPRNFKSGLYYLAPSSSTNTDTGVAQVLDRVLYVPFAVGEAVTADRIGASVTAFAATSVVRLGIYSSTDGQPDALVLDAGTIDASSNGYKEITISQALSANSLYWIAIVPQTAACTLRASAIGAGSEWVGTTLLTADIRTANYQQAGVSGVLPANATPLTGITQSPIGRLRAA